MVEQVSKNRDWSKDKGYEKVDGVEGIWRTVRGHKLHLQINEVGNLEKVKDAFIRTQGKKTYDKLFRPQIISDKDVGRHLSGSIGEHGSISQMSQNILGILRDQTEKYNVGRKKPDRERAIKTLTKYNEVLSKELKRTKTVYRGMSWGELTNLLKTGKVSEFRGGGMDEEGEGKARGGFLSTSLSSDIASTFVANPHGGSDGIVVGFDLSKNKNYKIPGYGMGKEQKKYGEPLTGWWVDEMEVHLKAGSRQKVKALYMSKEDKKDMDKREKFSRELDELTGRTRKYPSDILREAEKSGKIKIIYKAKEEDTTLLDWVKNKIKDRDVSLKEAMLHYSKWFTTSGKGFKGNVKKGMVVDFNKLSRYIKQKYPSKPLSKVRSRAFILNDGTVLDIGHIIHNVVVAVALDKLNHKELANSDDALDIISQMKMIRISFWNKQMIIEGYSGFIMSSKQFNAIREAVVNRGLTEEDIDSDHISTRMLRRLLKSSDLNKGKIDGRKLALGLKRKYPKKVLSKVSGNSFILNDGTVLDLGRTAHDDAVKRALDSLGYVEDDYIDKEEHWLLAAKIVRTSNWNKLFIIEAYGLNLSSGQFSAIREAIVKRGLTEDDVDSDNISSQVMRRLVKSENVKKGYEFIVSELNRILSSKYSVVTGKMRRKHSCLVLPSGKIFQIPFGGHERVAGYCFDNMDTTLGFNTDWGALRFLMEKVGVARITVYEGKMFVEYGKDLTSAQRRALRNVVVMTGYDSSEVELEGSNAKTVHREITKSYDLKKSVDYSKVTISGINKYLNSKYTKISPKQAKSSMWLMPNGTLYTLGYGTHGDVAYDYLESVEHDPSVGFKNLRGRSVDTFLDMGMVRTGIMGQSFYVDYHKNPTTKQMSVLRDIVIWKGVQDKDMYAPDKKIVRILTKSLNKTMVYNKYVNKGKILRSVIFGLVAGAGGFIAGQLLRKKIMSMGFNTQASDNAVQRAMATTYEIHNRRFRLVKKANNITFILLNSIHNMQQILKAGEKVVFNGSEGTITKTGNTISEVWIEDKHQWIKNEYLMKDSDLLFTPHSGMCVWDSLEREEKIEIVDKCHLNKNTIDRHWDGLDANIQNVILYHYGDDTVRAYFEKKWHKPKMKIVKEVASTETRGYSNPVNSKKLKPNRTEKGLRSCESCNSLLKDTVAKCDKCGFIMKMPEKMDSDHIAEEANENYDDKSEKPVIKNEQ